MHNNNNNSCVKTKLTLDLKPYKRHLAKNGKREKIIAFFSLSLSRFEHTERDTSYTHPKFTNSN